MIASSYETSVHPVAGISEPLCVLSHFAGALVFLLLSWPLLRRGRGDRWRVACLALFAVACVSLLTVSGVYHLIGRTDEAYAALRRIDHMTIFFLIAATFTVIHGILFTGPWRWGMLLCIWIACVTGMILSWVFLDRAPRWLPATLYLILGWLGSISGILLLRRYGFRFVAPLLYGGIAYTLGTLCLALMFLAGGVELIPGVIGRHELFHFAVLAGVGFHWKFVFSFAAGPPEQSGRTK